MHIQFAHRCRMTYSSAYAPVPSPAQRERGADGGVRAVQPRACALGYSMPPLTGLRNDRAHDKNYRDELVSHDTTFEFPAG